MASSQTADGMGMADDEWSGIETVVNRESEIRTVDMKGLFVLARAMEMSESQAN